MEPGGRVRRAAVDILGAAATSAAALALPRFLSAADDLSAHHDRHATIDWNGAVYAVWGSAPGDVWAGGSPPDYRVPPTVIHRWNGSAWAAVTVSETRSATLRSIWGSGPDDAWAAGYSWTGGAGAEAQYAGSLFHWNGTAWTDAEAPAGPESLGPIWGTAPDDVWLVGMPRHDCDERHVYHWDGANWTRAAVFD